MAASAFELLHNATFKLPPDTSDGVQITCHRLLPSKKGTPYRLLFSGLSNGSIVSWRKRADAPAGQVDSKVSHFPGHSGAVRCLSLIHI